MNVHGHNHPYFNRALKEQLGKIAHSTLLGAANIPSVQLAERLVHVAPIGLSKLFYSEDGAESVEPLAQG